MASPTSDAAYADFVRTAWDQHLRVARLLTGDPLRAEELLQDCLVKLYVRWRKVAARGDPQAYLRRMLVNGTLHKGQYGVDVPVGATLRQRVHAGAAPLGRLRRTGRPGSRRPDRLHRPPGTGHIPAAGHRPAGVDLDGRREHLDRGAGAQGGRQPVLGRAAGRRAGAAGLPAGGRDSRWPPGALRSDSAAAHSCERHPSCNRC
ncbi:sigma factor [Phytohabitans sp. LJ34]|uniref:sigma factor n=1 Tax=Phytohabitans sp. LJ34 TaxID=3452217 RepID=UPI003F8CDC38